MSTGWRWWVEYQRPQKRPFPAQTRGKLNRLQFVNIGNNWLTITYFSVHCVPSFGTAPPTWWSRPAMTTWTVWWNHQRPPERSFSTKNQGKLSILQFVNIGNNWLTLTYFRVHWGASLSTAPPTWWSRLALATILHGGWIKGNHKGHTHQRAKVNLTVNLL